KVELGDKALGDGGKVDELVPDRTRRYQHRFGLVRRAQLYDRFRQFDKALPDYNRAVKLPNAGLDPLIWRSEHWIRQGQWKQAAADYRQLWNKRDQTWYVEWYYSRERALLNLLAGDPAGYREAAAY